MAEQRPDGTPISDSLLARVVARTRKGIGDKLDDWFGPLDPLPPSAPDDVKGRAFDYQTGYNLNIPPRGGEREQQNIYQKLKALSTQGDIVRVLIETRKDQLAQQDIPSRAA